jgi:hypothetical protein
VIEMHLDRVRHQIRLQQLQRRLEASAKRLRRDGSASVEERLQTMTMISTHSSEEQLEWLRQRHEEVGEERIREVEAEWPRLMAEVHAELDAETDPSDPKVQVLMERWSGLVSEFTGGNPGIERFLTPFFEHEDTLPTGETIDCELSAYVGKAMAARK